MNSDSTQTSTTDNTPGLKRPFMLAYTVKPTDDGRKSIWSKIGAAWAHKDGHGYELRMVALPVDGRVVLRTVKDSGDDQTGELLEMTPE